MRRLPRPFGTHDNSTGTRHGWGWEHTSGKCVVRDQSAVTVEEFPSSKALTAVLGSRDQHLIWDE